MTIAFYSVATFLPYYDNIHSLLMQLFILIADGLGEMSLGVLNCLISLIRSPVFAHQCK